MSNSVAMSVDKNHWGETIVTLEETALLREFQRARQKWRSQLPSADDSETPRCICGKLVLYALVELAKKNCPTLVEIRPYDDHRLDTYYCGVLMIPDRRPGKEFASFTFL